MIAKRKRYTNREVNDTSQRIATMDEEPIELNEGTQHAVGETGVSLCGMRNCEFLACFIVQLHLHQTQQIEAAYNNVPDDHKSRSKVPRIYMPSGEIFYKIHPNSMKHDVIRDGAAICRGGPVGSTMRSRETHLKMGTEDELPGKKLM
jgi:hypothetical protein